MSIAIYGSRGLLLVWAKNFNLFVFHHEWASHATSKAGAPRPIEDRRDSASRRRSPSSKRKRRKRSKSQGTKSRRSDTPAADRGGQRAEVVNGQTQHAIKHVAVSFQGRKVKVVSGKKRVDNTVQKFCLGFQRGNCQKGADCKQRHNCDILLPSGRVCDQPHARTGHTGETMDA